jgi:transcriptional regulator with XRE-family HTH domain
MPTRTHRKDLGLSLRIARIKRGYIQLDLADALDMSPSSISLFEAGRRTPTDEQLSRICAVLGIRPRDLDGDAA